MMDIAKRNEKIYRMRESGVTYTEISKTFNISLERVRQIYFRSKYLKDNEDIAPPLKKLLSSRIRNGLIIGFKDEHIFANPEKIINETTLKDLRKVQNVGKKSIKELVDAMITLGYIKPDDKWLKE